MPYSIRYHVTRLLIAGDSDDGTEEILDAAASQIEIDHQVATMEIPF